MLRPLTNREHRQLKEGIRNIIATVISSMAIEGEYVPSELTLRLEDELYPKTEKEQHRLAVGLGIIREPGRM